jgi:hypothetical protein
MRRVAELGAPGGIARMKRLIRRIPKMVVLILILSACTKESVDLQQSIIGKWQQDGGTSDAIEFFAGGTLIGTRKDVTNVLTGRYSFSGSNRMQMGYDAPPPQSQPRTFDVSIAGETLVLSDGIIRWTYHRVK